LSLKVFHLTEEHGRFSWRDHLEQVADWEDTLIVDVGRKKEEDISVVRAWIAWNSTVAGAPDGFDPITDADVAFVRQGDVLYAEIPLPEISQPILGEAARIRMKVSQNYYHQKPK
jgi:hypothetical protein